MPTSPSSHNHYRHLTQFRRAQEGADALGLVDVLRLCADFGLLGPKLLSADAINESVACMQSSSPQSSPPQSSPSSSESSAVMLHPVSRSRFDELLYRLALQATERDPTLQSAPPRQRLLALLEALLMTNPERLKATLSGVQLLRLSAEGSLEQMKPLINAASVAFADGRGATPLHKASMYGHAAVVEALIGAGAAIQERTVEGWTALHLAAEYGHTGVAQDLVRVRASVGAESIRGWTPLHRAAIAGHGDVVGSCPAALRSTSITAPHRALLLHAPPLTHTPAMPRTARRATDHRRRHRWRSF